MKTGRKIIAVVTTKNGKAVVDLLDDNDYSAVALDDGSIVIVENQSQVFCDLKACYECPVCGNEEMEAGQRFCQICGKALE